MGKNADSWLVEVDRQALGPYLAGLADADARVSPELGEAFRILTFARPVDAAFVTRSGMARFAMPIEWQGDEASCAEYFADTASEVVALRRHDRFAADRLRERLPPGNDLIIAVAEGRVLAGRPAGFSNLPRRTPVAGPSRAGEKLAEALDVLGTAIPPAGSRWLELGAFPGGMTTELSRRGYLVSAVDLHPPTDSMRALAGVTCFTGPAEDFEPEGSFDALLSDVNGSPGRTTTTVARLARYLVPGGLVIFTLKLPRWDDAEAQTSAARETLAGAGVSVFAVRHLRQNRQELTLFARRERTTHGNLRHR